MSNFSYSNTNPYRFQKHPSILQTQTYPGFAGGVMNDFNQAKSVAFNPYSGAGAALSFSSMNQPQSANLFYDAPLIGNVNGSVNFFNRPLQNWCPPQPLMNDFNQAKSVAFNPYSGVGGAMSFSSMNQPQSADFFYGAPLIGNVNGSVNFFNRPLQNWGPPQPPMNDYTNMFWGYQGQDWPQEDDTPLVRTRRHRPSQELPPIPEVECPEPELPPIPEPVDCPKKKVFIIGSYDPKKWGGNGASLGDTIQNFSGIDTTANWGSETNSIVSGISDATWHNDDTANDEALRQLYSKMSAEDRSLSFNGDEAAYVIDEDGKILGKIGATQIVDKESLDTCDPSTLNYDSNWKTGGDGKNVISAFKIIEDVGVDKKTGYHEGSIYFNGSKGIKNLQEASSKGTIKLNGVKYDVAATAIRKDTPLAFDLNGDGVKTSKNVIQYDIDGDGSLDRLNDVGDATLTIRGGKNGKDLFGNNTDLDGDGMADGFKDGFQALKALARKENLINGVDDMKLDAKDLKKLAEKYQLAIKTHGYNSDNQSLESVGITEINLGKSDETTRTNNFDGQNNDILTQEGATFSLKDQEGKTQTRTYADVIHQHT